jgi:Tfp pilus assembly protein PilF
MGNKLLGFLLKFILPLVVIIILFIYNVLLGLVVLLLGIGFLLYRGRASLFAYIGSFVYSKGNLAGGINWFQRSYATGKAKPQTVSSYAYLLLKGGNVTDSEEILSKLIASHPDKDSDMYAKSNLALVLWKKGDLDGAIDMLENVIAEYKNTTVYGSLGYLLILKGDLDKALQFNLEAHEYNDTNTIIMDNLGQIYYLTGQYEKSAEIYEKLIAKNPTFPAAYYNYGLLLFDTNQLDKSKEMLEKSLSFAFSFLSTIKKEDIEEKLEEIKQKKALQD